MNTVQEIERAITTLSPEQLEDLYEWLDQNHSLLIDARIERDIADGRLEGAVRRALAHEKEGLTKPL